MQTHHRRQFVAVLVLSLLGVVGIGARPAVAAAPTAGMFFDGELGNPIFEGNVEHVAPDWTFKVDAGNTTKQFVMSGFDTPACALTDGGANCDWFTVKFNAPSDFAPNTSYDLAESYSAPSAGHPGIEISRKGVTCSPAYGRFDLLEYAADNTLKPTTFVARFEQHCGGDTPGLFGLVSFNGSSSGTDWYVRTVAPEPVDFGEVRLGETATMTITFDSDTEDPTLPDGFVISGPDAADFDIGEDDCVAAGNCSVDILFTPSDDGARDATFTFTDELAAPGVSTDPAKSGTGRDIPLTGTGFHGELSVSGLGLFGKGRVGVPTDVVDFQVTSVGTGPVVIDDVSINGTNPSSFDFETDCPDTLAVSESCDIVVFAYPTAAAPRAATLDIDNDGIEPLISKNLAVTGTLGYYLAQANGKVTGFGDALTTLGDMSAAKLNAPILGMATTPDGDGYRLIGGDGGIFSFGNAKFWGSMGSAKLNKPIFGMAATPDDGGYWLVASDGGIFAFGNAPFKGSMGGTPLNKPVVGIASTSTGNGYWMVASDGGIFSFGDAQFYGSMGATPLNQPIVGMAATATGNGYWLVAADGGVFAFGDAASHYYGNLAGQTLSAPILGMVPSPTGLGYWLFGSNGKVYTFGDAITPGGDLSAKGVSDVVAMAGTAPFVDPSRADGPNAPLPASLPRSG